MEPDHDIPWLSFHPVHSHHRLTGLGLVLLTVVGFIVLALAVRLTWA